MKSRKSIQTAEFSEFLKNQPSVEAVLAHDKTVEEVCCCNPELMNYITCSRLQRIIHYIIEEPEDPNDFVKACKFPLIASEFFSADLPVVGRLLLGEPELMRYLFSFAARKPLNFLLAGYFLKAFETCMAFDSDKFVGIIFDNQYHLLLLDLIASTSISEIMQSIIQQKGYIEERKLLIQKLCDLVSSPNRLTSTNSSNILQKLSKDDEIFSHFSSEPTSSQILSHLKSSVPTTLKNAGQLIKSLLSASPESIIPLLTPHLSLFSDIICKEDDKLLPTQFGIKIRPFGEHKIVILEIFAILCTYNIPELRICLPNILGLLPKYPWSSYFHNSFIVLIDSIINNQSIDLVQILINENFPQTLISLAEDSSILANKTQIPKGFVGHLYKLINVLANSKIMAIEENLKLTEKWTDFQGKLGKYNEIEAKNIGGKINVNFFDNMSSSSTDKADELDLIPDYPNSKPMTGKELEELNELFELEDKNSNKSPFMSTKVVKTATLEELKANEFLDNVYWKMEVKVDNLDELD